MPNYKKHSNVYFVHLWLALVCWATVVVAHDPNPIGEIKFIATKNQIIINAQFDVQLSETMRIALQHDIPLFFIWEVQLRQKSPWYWFDKTKRRYQVVLQLFYHRDSHSYRTIHARSQRQQIFSTLEAAIKNLSQLQLTLPREKINLHYGRMRFSLDKNKLPKPITDNTLFSREWNLTSKWHQAPVIHHE